MSIQILCNLHILHKLCMVQYSYFGRDWTSAYTSIHDCRPHIYCRICPEKSGFSRCRSHKRSRLMFDSILDLNCTNARSMQYVGASLVKNPGFSLRHTWYRNSEQHHNKYVVLYIEFIQSVISFILFLISYVLSYVVLYCDYSRWASPSRNLELQPEKCMNMHVADRCMWWRQKEFSLEAHGRVHRNARNSRMT